MAPSSRSSAKEPLPLGDVDWPYFVFLFRAERVGVDMDVFSDPKETAYNYMRKSWGDEKFWEEPQYEEMDGDLR